MPPCLCTGREVSAQPAVKPTGVTANNLPSTKSAKKRAVKKKQPCKWDEMTEKGYMSPQKKYQRTFAGKRVTSTGLVGRRTKGSARLIMQWHRSARSSC